MQVVTLVEPDAADGQPLFVNFVNTLHWDAGEPIELIGTDREFAAWLAEHGLADQPVTGGLSAVHVLREHTRALVAALASAQSPHEADRAALDVALGTPVGHLVLVGAGTSQPELAFETDASAAVSFAFRVALSLSIFQQSGDRHRLKLCANPGCGFAFVDTSINGTRRWCFMRYCGNRFKARAFRRRSRV
jgi:predicted RNA-binding Zn ribbon-like protein